jgi:phosphate transport system substrate-binding protein
LDNLRRIFTGDTVNWKQFGGPDAPVRALTRRPQESLGAAHFQERVLDGQRFGPGVQMLDTWSAVVKVCALAKDLPIGLAPALPMPRGVNLVAVKAMERTPAVLPDAQAIGKGSYPLLMPIRFYWDPGSRDQRVVKFVEYCNTQGLGSAPDRPRHASGTGVARMLLLPPTSLTP